MVKRFNIIEFFILSIVFAAIVGISAPVRSAEIVDRIVAVVNEDIIRLSDLERQFAPVEKRIKSENLDPEKEAEVLDETKKQILHEMINETLADQKTESAGISVGDEEVDAAIARVRRMNDYTEEDFLQALEMQGMDMASYRGEIRKQLLRSKLVNREVKSSIVITDSDISEYYESHPEEYGVKKKYDLKNIFMAHSQYMDDDDSQPVRKQMEDILEQLKNGASFTEMARLYSQAPNSEEGGELGAFAIDDLSENLRPVINGMEPGEFSEVIETDLGFQIFFLEDILNSGEQQLEEARAEIEEKIYEEAVNAKFETWIESMRKSAHIEIMY